MSAKTLLAGLGLLAAIAVIWRLSAVDYSSFTQTATSTLPGETDSQPLMPTYGPKPILLAEEAISRSVGLLPKGFVATDTVARLVSGSTAERWRGQPVPFHPDNAPVWLVGIVANGMTVADALPELYGRGAAYPGSSGGGAAALASQTITAVSVTPVQGMFFAWDANSGDELGHGVLAPRWPQTIQSLQALTNESIPIVAATEAVLMSPTEDWDPWPTP